MMKTYYLGAFPPEYGGVTVKNENLCAALAEKMNIRKVDFNRIKEKRVFELVKCVFALTDRRARYIVGISGRVRRKKFSKLLYFFNRNALKRSVLIVMGGTAARDIASDPEYKRYVETYRGVYVETQSMKTTLEDDGLRNVRLYPNGRFKPSREIPLRESNGKLKCVFFSLVQQQKGIDHILVAAKKLPNVDFYFYGGVDPAYSERFFAGVDQASNVYYKGVFKGTKEETYAELSQYDVLLFPTMWKTEGVPGILVEAKIAGLAVVASNESYNAELVKHGIEGIILQSNTGDSIAEVLLTLDDDRERLMALKKGSRNSASEYFIEDYVPELVNVLEGK